MAHRILVTGASGNIGSEIIKILKAKNADFSAASLGHHDYPADIRSLQFDYAHAGLLETAFEGVETLFLLIPLAPEMVEYARNAVQAAREAGVKYIVRPSSLGADPSSPYAIRKLQGEIDHIIHESGIPSVFVRPNVPMQAFVKFYGDPIRQGALYLCQGEGRTSFIDVRDVASVLAEILQDPAAHHGRFYTVTGGRAISNAEALAIISNHAHRRISYVPVTEEAVEAAMKKTGMDSWFIEMFLSQHRAAKEGEHEVVTDTVKKFVGRDPRSFESFCFEKAHEWDSREFYRGSEASP